MKTKLSEVEHDIKTILDVAWTEVNRQEDGAYSYSEHYRLAFTRIRPLLEAAPEMVETLRAIVDRINGVYDSPSLMAMGPLQTNEIDDIRGWAEAIIRKLRAQ